MKKNLIVQSLISIFVVGLGFAAIAQAWTNLTISSSSAGATPTLAQVTAEGATTADAITLTGLLTFGNITGTNATATNLGVTNNIVVGGFVSSTRFIATTGTAALPSFTFNGDTNTGLFNVSSDVLGISLGGSDKIHIGAASIYPAGQNAYDLGLSGYAWRNLYVSSTAYLGGGVYATSGLPTNPAYSFYGDTDTGMYASQANSIDFTANGVQILNMNNSYANFIVSILPLYDGAYVLGAPTVRWAKIDVINVSTTGQISAPDLSPLSITGDFVCQNNSNGALQVGAANCTVSSIRFKEHVESLSDEDLMERVRALRAVEFDYRQDNDARGLLGTKHDEGFIAEEVALIDPYLVAWEMVKEDSPELEKIRKAFPSIPRETKDGWLIPLTVDYMKVSVLESGAIRNIDERLKEIESRIGILESVSGFLRGLFD